MTSQQKFEVTCQQCGLNALCIPHSLTNDEIDQVDETIKRTKPLQKNDLVFETGARFTSLFAIRAGSVKTFNIENDGTENVTGFFFPGELIGLDAIASGAYVNSAQTLETSALCEIPFDRVQLLSQKIPNLQAHMYRLLSREIEEDQELKILLGKKSADQRIGAFLLNLSERFKRRHLSATTFRLPMARADIGNYLGLAVETVSRVLTKLQEQNILLVEGKDLRIKNHQQLCSIAHQVNY